MSMVWEVMSTSLRLLDGWLHLIFKTTWFGSKPGTSSGFLDQEVWGLVIFLGLMFLLKKPGISRGFAERHAWYWQKSKTMNIRHLPRKTRYCREPCDIAWPWVKHRLKSYDCREMLRKIRSLSSHEVHHDFLVQINSASYLKKAETKVDKEYLFIFFLHTRRIFTHTLQAILTFAK